MKYAFAKAEKSLSFAKLQSNLEKNSPFERHYPN